MSNTPAPGASSDAHGTVGRISNAATNCAFGVHALIAHQCKDVHLQTASEFGASLQVPFNCVRQGQIEDQKWIEQYPGWRIERWKCPPVDRREVSF